MIPRNPLSVVVALLLVFPAFSVLAAADTVTVGTVTASGTTVDVPISIRDASGTPLGVDQPAGSRIQSLSIRVNYAPASAVQSVSIARAGITADLNAVSEFKPSTSSSIALLVTFQESTNPIPFGLNATPPGNLVAHLLFTLSASAVPGTTITLTLDPSLTQLTDSGGSAATKETVANGALGLVNGKITVPPLSVSLTPTSRTIEPGSSTDLTAQLSSVAPSDTTVALSSNNTNVATVPASIVIPTGASSGSVRVTAVALGTARITATLNSSSSSSNITVAEPPPPCTKPVAPQLNAPASVRVGAAYDVTWNAVTAATDYVLEESTDAGFATSASQTLTATTASFTHDAPGRFYYRVRARNRAGACNAASVNSEVVAVQVSEAAAPQSAFLAVVGSLPGNFGSYFRTSLQLYNPRAETMTGRIVFHPAGASGSSNDPSLAYSIAGGKTLAFADLLPAMGLQGGIGSVDLIADVPLPLPVSLARVFNDAGASGTTGLSEEALAASDALQAGHTGVVIAPSDVRRFRLNVGMRTLDQGAAVVITVRDKEGAVVKTRSRDYPATFFEQVDASSLLEGYVLSGGETITFALTRGSAFIYGSTTDNTTNDPSVQFARRVE